MNRKNIVLIIILLFGPALGMSALAATDEAHYSMHQDATGSIDNIIFKLKIYLALTDKQGEQIKPIIQEDLENRDEIMNVNKGDQAAAKSALDELRSQTSHKLSDYLTEKQLIDYEKMRDSRQDQMGTKKGGKGGRGGMGGGKRGFGRAGF
jgi:hypothetical protein